MPNSVKNRAVEATDPYKVEESSKQNREDKKLRPTSIVAGCLWLILSVEVTLIIKDIRESMQNTDTIVNLRTKIAMRDGQKMEVARSLLKDGHSEVVARCNATATNIANTILKETSTCDQEQLPAIIQNDDSNTFELQIPDETEMICIIDAQKAEVYALLTATQCMKDGSRKEKIVAPTPNKPAPIKTPSATTSTQRRGIFL